MPDQGSFLMLFRLAVSFLLGILLTSTAQAAVQIVNDFGANGWYSWDTRNTTGTQLVGLNNTSPLWPGVHTAEHDTQIENQIKFLGENVTVADAAGGSPDPSPTGSLNGLGYVRLDGTNSNNGKSDISYLSATGIAAATALADPLFGTAYRYYTDSNTTNRTPGLNIATVDPSDTSKVFTFNHVQTPYTPDAWNIEAVDGTTSLFNLYGQSAPGGTVSKTLTDWFDDPTWGPQLTDDVIFRVGFNIGSSQRDALIYIDWIATSLLNDGDAIDFQSPAIVPEASSIMVWGLIAGGMGLCGVRRSSHRAR
jgi:hypothetical protein